jgi:(1->4)-alpha-D-glucan 1-alpha-D-glucosylmutase
MSDDWIATYRLQLHAEFPLPAAQEILPYLSDLGISHVYLSPCLQAVSGSRHGYDIADPSRINAEIGGEEAWKQFNEQARAHGLRLLLDIVPNHMAASDENPWWDDVLAHGPYSKFASFFDLAPRTGEENWRLQLAPLGRPYGDVLAAGELKIKLHDNRPRLHYFEHSWPLGPVSWGIMLGEKSASKPAFRELERLQRLAAPTASDRAAYDQNVAQAEGILQEAIHSGSFDDLGCFIGSPDRLHRLLERQFYALHGWKLAGELVNYRRFFDIGSLVGLRMESPEVFEAAHARIVKMISDGEIDGLRIDHPDGLRDPQAYFFRLRQLLPRGHIYTEKILENEELLREEWPVDGTVGYDFLSKVNRLWMDDEKADMLTAAYSDFTGHSVNFPALVREKKREIIETTFAADLERLTDLAQRIARASWQTRDLSRRHLREALKRLTTLLPVYRTYRTEVKLDKVDDRILTDTLAAARAGAPELEAALNFLETILTGSYPEGLEADLIARWQQLAPAVTAKGVEDTTFYCYDRLVSCNEVGAQASLMGISAGKFHEFCHYLSEHWPNSLLATSTHDTKRSEDVRARISVLTERPHQWVEMLHKWSRMNMPAWKGRAPDRHAEYLLYQTLVGAWPIDRDRCWNYMLKACREAKILTSWHEPNASYEEAIRDFIDGLFASQEFITSLGQFVEPLAFPGRVNSLAQTLIKVTAPGVPDFYQGSELWDLSLVDPDNRRPVDFEFRKSLLARCRSMAMKEATANWDSGLPKLWMIARVLGFRREKPRYFSRGNPYQPLVAQGDRLGHLLAFQRGENLITVVPRFVYSLKGEWGDTQLKLPPGGWKNLFTDAMLAGDASPALLFGGFPVALLVKETSP